ncbi:mucin-19-like [Anopheles darlingi]|uniref:mucin-19-like n=1 Tax=Anopheles darlingi TaxID=43151 RepID=UPI002100511F|nr:mucin-19-like [Anopheles darlingi]
MFANGGNGSRVPQWMRILSMSLVIFTGVIGAIEVHEDVNEGPIVSARLNVSSGSGSGGTSLTTKLPPLVNERNVNDPGSPTSQHHQHQQQQYQGQHSSIDEPAHNFTTFPSNHRQQHADVHGNGNDAPTTVVATVVESVAVLSTDDPAPSTTTSRASPEGPAGPVTPSTAITTASQSVPVHQPASSPSAVGGLAAFRAASNSNSQSKSPSIARDRARTRTVQHQISGYRKRQLYASATQPRNANGSTAGNEPASDQSNEAPFSRDFVPSPEVGVYYGDESSPMVPIQPPSIVSGSSNTQQVPQAPRTVAVEHGGFVPHAVTPAVDALYPATAHSAYGDTTAGDNRWYTGAGISTTPVVRGHHHLKTSTIPTTVKWGEHKYPMWSHPQSQQQQHPQTNTVKFPQEAVTSQVSQFPTPKGKWKWIPEEEDGGESGKERPGDSGVTFSSVGTTGSSTSEESSLLRQQPAVVTLARPSSVYTYERIPSSVELPVPGGTAFSSEGVSGGGAGAGTAGGNSSTEVTGGTSKEVLFGKDELQHKGAAMSPWKKIIHVLTAAIPIGLLISALTPQVVYINPNATLPPQSTQLQTPSPVSGAGLSSGGLRQRSLDATGVPDPIGAIQLFQKLMALERDAEQAVVAAAAAAAAAAPNGDVSNRLMNAAVTATANRLQHCDWMLLCQLVHQRQSPESVAVRRMLWKMANE